MLFGRTPVTEVLAFLDEELAWGREHGLAAIEADALLGGPVPRFASRPVRRGP